MHGAQADNIRREAFSNTSSDEFTRFRVQVNDEEFDEHVACDKIVSFIDEHFQQSEQDGCWTMRRMLAHDHLHPDDPRMCDKAGNRRFRKDCKHVILLEWEDGQRSWEDPRLFDGDSHEVTVAAHARENQLLLDPFWSRYRRMARKRLGV